LKILLKKGHILLRNIFDDFEASLNVKVEGEVGDIINQINNEVQTLLLVEMEIVENSTVGDYVPDIIRGVDYSDFLEVYKDRNLKEAITELTSKLATGEKLLGL